MTADPTRRPSLIALDWGSSSLRAYLLDAEGAVLESRSGPWGILQLPHAALAERFAAVTAEWRASWPGLPAIAAGMIGSAQGWIEAPYCGLPAGAAELSARLAAVPGADLMIVPGLVQGALVQNGQAHDEARTQPSARPDVMRGEETQIAGALALRPGLASRARLIMPGTHCKWVDVADGRIVGFSTYMTGELFAVLRHHSILGRLAPENAALSDTAAFLRGVDAAKAGAGPASSGLSALLFSARALVLTGHLAGEDSLAYLSGLLIGDEINSALPGQDAASGDPPILIGDPVLCGRYRQALARFGVQNPEILDNAAPMGLWRIATAARLLPSVPL